MASGSTGSTIVALACRAARAWQISEMLPGKWPCAVLSQL